MRTYLDCIPCIIRQTLDSVRLVTPDELVHQRLVREALQAAAEMDPSQTPPAMAQWIHRRIRAHTGQVDPYREIKDRFNQMALNLYPTFQEWVRSSDSPLETVVRLVIAGNIIDFGVNSHVSEAQVRESIMHALSAPVEGDVEAFSAAVGSADNILYLTDNAGEIVFDRLLIERLPRGKVTVAVRGSPAINDATLADAKVAGIDEVAEVIDNGSDAPGTILDDCSALFRSRFDETSLVIAKGQGNYETLSEVDKDIYFLLKAKCPVVARDLRCQEGAMVLAHSRASPAASRKS